jgi:hypothetical protein
MQSPLRHSEHLVQCPRVAIQHHAWHFQGTLRTVCLELIDWKERGIRNQAREVLVKKNKWELGE